MPNVQELRAQQEANVAQRREFVKRWAEYVREADDAEWSAQVNDVIDAQYRDDE